MAELKRLIADLSDGQLQPADRDRLEQLLLAHREARSMYMAYMQIDAGLDWKVRGGQSVHGLTDMTFERAVTAASSDGARRRAGAGNDSTGEYSLSLRHWPHRLPWCSHRRSGFRRDRGQAFVAALIPNCPNLMMLRLHSNQRRRSPKSSNCPTNAAGSWRTAAKATAPLSLATKSASPAANCGWSLHAARP